MTASSLCVDDHLKGVWDGCIAHIHAAEVILIPRQETPGEGESRVAEDETSATLLGTVVSLRLMR